MNRSTIASLLIAFTYLPTSSLAETDSAKTAAELGGVATQTGLSVIQTWRSHDGITVPPSTLPLAEQSSAVEKALSHYVRIQNGYDGIARDGTIASTAIGGIASGAAILVPPHFKVPVLLFGAGSSLTVSEVSKDIAAQGQLSSQQLLGLLADTLVAESGAASFAELVADRERLEATLRQSEAILTDVRARAEASGDPNLVDRAVRALAQVGYEAGAEALLASAELASDLATVDARVGAFMGEVDARIDRLEASTGLAETFGPRLDRVEETLQDMQVEVAKLGTNQALIVDFMFSGLSPADKAAALRSGLMDDRIRCPETEPSCDPARIRASLIEGFEAQAEMMESVMAVQDAQKVVANALTIANNLGIELPEEVGDAVKIGMAAANLYIAYQTGDIMGGLVAVSSLFGGGGSDPDAERFAIMMAYLKEQFAIVNEKLDLIIKNQAAIFDAVVAVSEQLEATYIALDGRLASMQYEQEVIAANLRSLIWGTWGTCYAVYDYAVNPNATVGQPAIVDLSTMSFPSFDAVQEVLAAREAEVLDCRQQIVTSVSGVTAMSVFSNFLDDDKIFERAALLDPGLFPAPLRPENGAEAVEEVKEEAFDWRSLAQRRREELVDPSITLALNWREREQMSMSTLALFLGSRIEDVTSLERALALVKADYTLDCTSDDPAIIAMRVFLCRNDGDGERVASDLVRAAVNAQMTLEISSWMPVVAQVLDLYLEDEDFATTIPEIATARHRHGEEVSRLGVAMLTMAILSESRLHGGLTASILAEDLTAGRAGAAHRSLMENNAYLAENTAIVLLYRARETWDLEEAKSTPSFADRYTQAILHMEAGASPDQFVPMQALFGSNLRFVVDASGHGAIAFSIDGTDVLLPLPMPRRLVEGRFAYPPRYGELISRRAELVDRNLDYVLARDPVLVGAVLAN